MTSAERLRAAQERDVRDMAEIYMAVAGGADPDAAAAVVVGGEFRLSDFTKSALREDLFARG